MGKSLVRCMGVAWLCVSSAAYAAESYPARPIRLIVPFSAGGAADIIARLLGSAMSKGLRSEEHTSELQSLRHLVCRLLLEKKKRTTECCSLLLLGSATD